jgi:hypothetical protein
LCISPINFLAPKYSGDLGRIAVDPTTKLSPDDTGAANDQIPAPGTEGRTDENPRVFYGTALMRLLQLVWNLRISHPDEDILITADDISAAYRRVLYHPAMGVVFASVYNQYLIVPVGTIFGARNSPSLYMILGELRAWYATAQDFSTVTTNLTQQVQLAPELSEDDRKNLEQAVKDEVNQGAQSLRAAQGTPQSSFVDDNGMAATREEILEAINSSVLAAYTVFGFPLEDRRPPCLNERKWRTLITHILRYLGFEIDTRQMTVRWPADKRERLRTLITDKWKPDASLKDPLWLSPKAIAQTLGLIGSGGIASQTARYLSLRLQFCLNSAVSAKTNTASTKWWVTARVRVPLEARKDVRTIHQLLSAKNAEIYWTTPIGLIVPRTKTTAIKADSSFEGMGGWCKNPPFMWRLSREDLIKCGFDIPRNCDDIRSKTDAENFAAGHTHAQAIINILEFIASIISLWFFVTLTARDTTKRLHLHRPTLFSDNTCAVSWLEAAARTKRAPVRRLAVFAQMLLTHCGLSIQVESTHIAGILNIEADALSRFSVAKSWASVISKMSQQLGNLPPYQVPLELLLEISRLLSYNATEATSVPKMTRLLTLEPKTLQDGWKQSDSMTSMCKRSHRSKSSRS